MPTKITLPISLEKVAPLVLKEKEIENFRLDTPKQNQLYMMMSYGCYTFPVYKE